MNHNEIDNLFMTIIIAQGQDPYNADVSTYKWKPELIINGKKIDDIMSNDGETVNLVWYDKYEDPEPLEYYNRETIIQPNKNLFVVLFGGKV